MRILNGIFKKNEDLSNVPGWADFLSPSEYSKFLKSLNNYFRKKNIKYELGDGLIKVGSNKFGFNQLGLSNIAQLCKLEGVSKYKKLIGDHFDSLIKANEFDSEFQKIVDDYEKSKSYLGVRLYNDEYLEQIGEELVISRNVAPEINEMLIYDLPESVTSVQPEQASKWGKTYEELFEIGANNLKSKYNYNISHEDFGGFKIWFVQADHFFVPNILLELAENPKMIGSKGSLIGAPHRHAVIIYPIEDLEVVTAINQLIPTIKGMNTEGPGSLSPNLYWFYDEKIVSLPYELENEQLKFTPPESFVSILNSLNEKEKS